MGEQIHVGAVRLGQGGCPYCLNEIAKGERTVSCVRCEGVVHLRCVPKLVPCPTPGCEAWLDRAVALSDGGVEVPPEVAEWLDDPRVKPSAPAPGPSHESHESRRVFVMWVGLGAAAGAGWAMSEYIIGARQPNMGVWLALSAVGGLAGAPVGALLGQIAVRAGRREHDVPGAVVLNVALLLVGSVGGTLVGTLMLGWLLGGTRAATLGGLLGTAAAAIVGRRTLGWNRFVVVLRALSSRHP